MDKMEFHMQVHLYKWLEIGGQQIFVVVVWLLVFDIKND